MTISQPDLYSQTHRIKTLLAANMATTTQMWLARSFITLIISYAASLHAYGSVLNPNEINSIINKADTLKLHENKYWLKLLHYTDNTTNVVSHDFFISNSNERTPKNELNATIKALYNVDTTDPDRHAQCRFIARYNWLKGQLNLNQETLPAVKCDKFDRYSINGYADSISLIFATGYLDNPASFYGHILLRFNTDSEDSSNALLAPSINYGAIVDEADNPILYVAKGIFGGYKATYTNNKYYEYNHIYIENELRDMWEYKLSLTPEEATQILHHSWELMGTKFAYYFIDENCANKMAELLELIVTEPLYDRNIPWTPPSSVFEKLMQTNHNNKDLVKTITYIPSRRSVFYEKYRTLSNDQKYSLAVIIEHQYDFSIPAYQKLAEQERAQVVDTLIDYNEYLIVKNKKTSDKNNKLKTLLERSKLPTAQSKLPATAYSTSPPTDGPLPTLIRTSVSHNSNHGSSLTLQLRPAYFDSLSLDEGRLPNSYLTMFDLKATYINEHLKLKSLDIVNIESLNIAETKLPYDNAFAWKIQFGLYDQNLACTSCKIFNINGGIGKAKTITHNIIAFGLLGGYLQSNKNEMGTLGLNASAGLLANPTYFWKTQLTGQYQEYINGSQSHSTIWAWNNRFGKSRDWDIRLSYRSHMAKEIELGVSLYW